MAGSAPEEYDQQDDTSMQVIFQDNNNWRILEFLGFVSLCMHESAK